MHRSLIRMGLVVVCGTTLVACSPPGAPDSRALPYLLVPARDLAPDVQAVDLDGDGIDELLDRHIPSRGPAGVSAVWIKTHEGQTIDQVNFEGSVQASHFLDVEGDGVPEIFVPYVRDDSLFVSVLGARGKRRFGFFLCAGRPRQEAGSVMPWDPSISAMHLVRADSAGRSRLVTVVRTGFARAPRGVFLHRLPEGERLGQQLVGAYPDGAQFGDFDEDGRLEVVFGSQSPNNGAEVGGFEDRYAYLIALDVEPTPTVAWAERRGGRWSRAHLAREDFDGDGRPDFLAITSSDRTGRSRMELIEAGTWRTFRHRAVDEPLGWPEVLDLDRDTQPEIVALRFPDEVLAFNAQFDEIRRRRIGGTPDRLEVLPDMDGDGVEEVIALTQNGAVLLGPDLQAKARFSEGRPERMLTNSYFAALHRGIHARPLLLIKREGRTVAMEMAPNRWYWLYRHGGLALGLLGFAVALGVLLGGRALYRRNRVWKHVYPVVVDSAANGLLVLDPEGRVVLENAALREGVGLGVGWTVQGQRYDVAFKDSPAFVTFLRHALSADPPHHHGAGVKLGADGEPGQYVSAEPVRPGPGSAPYWLVAFRDGKGKALHLDAKMWFLMAQEVTHAFKTPLSTILLTAQNLQMAYRKQAPAVSDELDPYTERIVERVSELRWKAKQLMKVLDVNALELVRSDLSEVVSEMRGPLGRDLPPGIDLVFRLEPDPPPVQLDREQIQTALENLVANAFRALGDGGTVTVSTRSVSDLRLEHTAYEPADYVVLEVQDNGEGIAEADRPHLFEPGFTTSEFGTGLGLALVWRVALHHGGFVEVESEEGAGSIFSLYLPTARPPCPRDMTPLPDE